MEWTVSGRMSGRDLLGNQVCSSQDTETTRFPAKRGLILKAAEIGEQSLKSAFPKARGTIIYEIKIKVVGWSEEWEHGEGD